MAARGSSGGVKNAHRSESRAGQLDRARRAREGKSLQKTGKETGQVRLVAAGRHTLPASASALPNRKPFTMQDTDGFSHRAPRLITYLAQSSRCSPVPQHHHLPHHGHPKDRLQGPAAPALPPPFVCNCYQPSQTASASVAGLRFIRRKPAQGMLPNAAN